MAYVIENMNQYMDKYHELKSGFPWDTPLIKMFCAMVSLTSKQDVFISDIKEMRAYIKQNSSVFSNFRGMNELMLATLMAKDMTGQERFDLTAKLYQDLKSAGFKSGTYLPLAAYTLAGYQGDYQSSHLIERMSAFYKGMKEKHFWLTGQDDYVFAALLAMGKSPVDTAIEHMEIAYEDLAQIGFKKGNGLQSLSHILTMGEEAYQSKLLRVEAIEKRLRDAGYRLRDHYMPVIGVFSLLGERGQELVDESVSSAEWLKAQRGFGAFSIDKKTRFLLASSLTLNHEVHEMANNVNQTILANSIQSIIIAQQAATMASIVAISAAASASSSS
jgi:hypothetical protein